MLNENLRRLQTGLTKLRDTNDTVAQLQEKVKEFQPKVQQKAVDAEVMLKKVAVDQKEADETKMEVEAEERIVARDAEEVCGTLFATIFLILVV